MTTTLEDFPDSELAAGLLAIQLRQRFGIGSGLRIILEHSINSVIERYQQRYVTRDDLARTRMALLICAAPPLSANKPDRILLGQTVLRD